MESYGCSSACHMSYNWISAWPVVIQCNELPEEGDGQKTCHSRRVIGLDWTKRYIIWCTFEGNNMLVRHRVACSESKQPILGALLRSKSTTHLTTSTYKIKLIKIQKYLKNFENIYFLIKYKMNNYKTW